MDLIIDITENLKKGKVKIHREWENSKHIDWFANNNYSKGAHGVYAYKVYLDSLGAETKNISDEGDLKYRFKKSDTWRKAEVKTSKATLNVLCRPKGFVSEHLWFNQIRPMQSGWHEIVLVGVYPNHIRIWRKSREQWETGCKTLSSMVKGLSHVGSDQLGQVTLMKNTKKNNFNEWECIHTDQQGEQL